MSDKAQVISPPSAPTLNRITPLRETVVNSAGEAIEKVVPTPLPITIQGNTMYFVRAGGTGAKVRELTNEEVLEYKELSQV